MENKLSKIVNIQEGIDKTNAHVFCADAFGIEPKQIFWKTRKEKVIMAKHLWRYVWWCFTNNPSLMEKLKFGDRCTVLHSLKTINNLCLYNSKVKTKVENIEKVYGIKIINAYIPNDYFYDKNK